MSSFVVLALASTALAAERESDEQLFIPSVEEPAGQSQEPLFKEEVKNDSSAKTDRVDRVAESSRRLSKTASSPRMAASAAGMSGWTWGLIALGATAAVVVPACLMFRRRRQTPHIGLALVFDETPRRARAASQTFLAASLIQTQQKSDEFAEVLYTERQKSRRAA
ncbi:MAG: hypothetical protein ABFC77_07920 [Thermoguttaceae bacterium]